jgi:hypothetical protein
VDRSNINPPYALRDVVSVAALAGSATHQFVVAEIEDSWSMDASLRAERA